MRVGRSAGFLIGPGREIFGGLRTSRHRLGLRILFVTVDFDSDRESSEDNAGQSKPRFRILTAASGQPIQRITV